MSLAKLLRTLLSLGSIFASVGLLAQGSSDEELFELTPFEVTGGTDDGYRATSTLAGTRLRTDMRDIGSSISIVNEEFLRDTDSSNLEDVLIFTPNTEVGGLGGNHSGSQGANPIPAQQRGDPSGGYTRVRGLASADLTRDYFITNIPFDTFNTDRVEVQRGANSALFGLGSPGGIINSSTIRADFYGDRGRVRIQTDENGTARYSFRYNKMVNDNLAIRVAALSEDRGYEQKQAFLEDSRYFASVTAKLPFNLTARGNIEVGNRNSSNPDYVLPNDGITPWINLGKPTSSSPAVGAATFRGTGDIFPGVAHKNIFHLKGAGQASVGYYRFYQDPTDPNPTRGGHSYLVATAADRALAPEAQRPVATVNGFTGPQGQWMAIKTWDENNIIRRTGGYRSDGTRLPDGWAPFFSNGHVSHQITNRRVFDYRKNLFSGGMAQQYADWENLTASIEGSWFDNRLGLEFSHNEQTFESADANSLQGVQQRTIYIDMNEHMLATTDGTGTGELIDNPTFGRPIMGGGSGGNRTYNDRDATRLQGYAEVRFDDFMAADSWLTKALGKFTITGLLDESTHYNQTLYSARSDPLNHYDLAINTPGHHVVSARSGQEFALPVARDMNFLNISSINDLAGAGIGAVPFGRERTNMQTAPMVASFTGWNPTAGQFVDFESTVNTLYQPDSWPAASHANKSMRTVESEVLIGQHSLWDNTVVLTGTWRNDKATEATGVGRSTTKTRRDIRDTLDPVYLAGPQGPYKTTADDDTTSYSIMVHTPAFLRDQLPFELSAYTSEADNFRPTGSNITIFNDTVGATAGTTEEMGFIVEGLDGKLSARFNFYESSVVNNRFETGALYQPASILTGLAHQVNNPANAGYSVADVQAVMPPDGVIGSSGFQVDWSNPEAATSNRNSSDTGTQDFTAKGMEIEIAYNPIAQWTILLTAGEQETVADNTYPEMRRFVDEFVKDNWVNSSFAQNYYIDAGATQTLAEKAETGIVEAVARAALQDGSPSKEQARWRYALNTAYQFGGESDIIPSWLGDLTVGGGYRWIDRTGIGFRLDTNELGDLALDVNQPFNAARKDYVDLFARTSYELGNDLSLDLQLNIKDLFNNDGLVPFVANPDGSKFYRIEEGRLISASATINF